MDADGLWALVEETRFDTAVRLERLTADEWASPTLCRGWTVRTLAGHLLVHASTSPGERTRAVLRHGGVERAHDHLARELADRPRPELTASLRAAVGDQTLPPRTGPAVALTEAVVHALDIWIALGHPPTPPSTVAISAVLDHLVGPAAPRAIIGRGRLEGLCLIATDAPWRHGHGTEVHGPAWALVLTVAGRRAALPALGAAAPLLAGRLGRTG